MVPDALELSSIIIEPNVSVVFLSKVEQGMKRAASERRREFNEEQRNEYEKYAEEDRDGENPTGFLLHLISTCSRAFPSMTVLGST